LPQKPIKVIGRKKMVVALTVEVFDSPGGNGQRLGDLDAGTNVGVNNCDAENWCKCALERRTNRIRPKERSGVRL
jgi:hypothetical protein